jgi:hypothetical protein
MTTDDKPTQFVNDGSIDYSHVDFDGNNYLAILSDYIDEKEWLNSQDWYWKLALEEVFFTPSGDNICQILNQLPENYAILGTFDSELMNARDGDEFNLNIMTNLLQRFPDLLSPIHQETLELVNFLSLPNDPHHDIKTSTTNTNLKHETNDVKSLHPFKYSVISSQHPLLKTLQSLLTIANPSGDKIPNSSNNTQTKLQKPQQRQQRQQWLIIGPKHSLCAHAISNPTHFFSSLYPKLTDISFELLMSLDILQSVWTPGFDIIKPPSKQTSSSFLITADNGQIVKFMNQTQTSSFKSVPQHSSSLATSNSPQNVSLRAAGMSTSLNQSNHYNPNISFNNNGDIETLFNSTAMTLSSTRIAGNEAVDVMLENNIFFTAIAALKFTAVDMLFDFSPTQDIISIYKSLASMVNNNYRIPRLLPEEQSNYPLFSSPRGNIHSKKRLALDYLVTDHLRRKLELYGDLIGYDSNGGNDENG